MIEEDDPIDASVHLPEGMPIITPERQSKGDLITGPPCDTCTGTGRHSNSICKKCRGRGWNGEAYAKDIPISDIHFAQSIVRNILNLLWEADVITDDQHNAGHVFEAWRNQHRVALGQQKAISTEADESLGDKLRAYGYVLLVRRLSIYECNAINSAIDVFANPHTAFIALRSRVAYRQAFDRLEKILPPIRDRIVHIEKLSADELNAHSEEELKNLLAKIHQTA